MGNLSHAISEMSNGNDFYTLRKKLNFIITSIGLYHLYLALIFFLNRNTPLSIYNSVALLYYSVFINGLIKKENLLTAMSLSTCEVVLCSLVSTLCTGMETGFSIFTIGCITASFYMAFVINAQQKQNAIAFIISVLLFFCYILSYIISIYIDPLTPIENVFWIRLLHISNYAVVFVMIVIFTFLIVWEVLNKALKIEAQNAELNELALKDPLTHLYNRRSMNDILANSMSILKTKGKRFSLILADIDNFKKINDTYGHDVGDAVLIKVSELITECVGTQGSVCRWGGEEILISINASIESASTIAERIREVIENTYLTADNVQFNVTMTLGVAESIPGYKIETLIQQADDRLYYGKNNGKNQVVISLP